MEYRGKTITYREYVSLDYYEPDGSDAEVVGRYYCEDFNYYPHHLLSIHNDTLEGIQNEIDFLLDNEEMLIKRKKDEEQNSVNFNKLFGNASY